MIIIVNYCDHGISVVEHYGHLIVKLVFHTNVSVLLCTLVLGNVIFKISFYSFRVRFQEESSREGG